MKCEEFNDKLEKLTGKEIPEDMKSHMTECSDCRDYYSVIHALTPAVYPKTPEGIKTNILKKVKRKQQFKAFITMKNRASILAASVAGIAAIALSFLLTANPTHASAAVKLIDKSLISTENIRSMIMKIDVRTDVRENFSYIDIDGPMVQHTLTVQRDTPPVWRLDKGWRTVVFDGNNKFMFTPDNNIRIKGNRNAGFEEWFTILLDPEMTLLNEKVATEDKGTKYTVKEIGNEIIMTASVSAKGDFTNPYLRNTSIQESDTRREIVFDKQTSLIKSMKIFVKDKSREVLVVDIKSIEYNVPLNRAEITAVEQGVEWIDVSAQRKATGKFAGITPEQAAQMIFSAVENNDIEQVKEAFGYYDIDKILEGYKGLRLIRLGKSFKSGSYPGVFVPYEVRMPNGKIVKHNLALRNDNPNKEWMIDGGI